MVSTKWQHENAHCASVCIAYLPVAVTVSEKTLKEQILTLILNLIAHHADVADTMLFSSNEALVK